MTISTRTLIAAARCMMRYSKSDDAKTEHEFSTTQLDLDVSASNALQKTGEEIPKSDLAEDGVETDSHVTILFGLHADSADQVAELVKGFGPISVEFGESSLFPANKSQEQRGGSQFDVLKIDIKSPKIRELHELLKTLDHTSAFPKYSPHATIAYLKPGDGEKYTGPNSLTGTKATFDSFEFSGKDRKKTTVSLK